MARSALPDPLARRHLLERALDSSQALRIAEAYLAQERTWEALGFLVKAGARERLEELAARAVEEGDAFLLREASRALGERPGVERWRALADAARSAGKLRYVAEAERQMERGEGGE